MTILRGNQLKDIEAFYSKNLIAGFLILPQKTGDRVKPLVPYKTVKLPINKMYHQK